MKENRDTIVESGREIVEIRREIAAVKSNSEFRVVGGREAARGFVGSGWGGVALTVFQCCHRRLTSSETLWWEVKPKDLQILIKIRGK